MLESRETPWTYTPTDHEMIYLREALGSLFEDEWLADILFKVKGGKEATVYCCRAQPHTGLGLVAAKVYRPRMFRAMRNDSFYRIGRTVQTPDGHAGYRGRALRALRKRTAFGREIEQGSWIGREYGILKSLHEAGAAVPAVYASTPSAIVMEYLGDDVRGAPVLHGVRLDVDEAHVLFERVMRVVELMLREYLVHGDLSAHNVLYWDGEVRVIDFPQAVDAEQHPAGFELLARDVERVCQYFRKQGVEADAVGMAMGLWERFRRCEL